MRVTPQRRSVKYAGVRKFCDGVYNGFDKMPGSDGQTDGEKSSINIARVITITRDKNIFNSIVP